MSKTHAGDRTTRARVLIVDDFPVVRRGLSLIIDAQPDMQVCAEAATVDEALEHVRTHHPELALVDISLNGAQNGIELTRHIRDISPATRVCMLSMHQHAAYAKRAFAAGASGYAMKTESPTDLLKAMRRILKGKTYASKSLSSQLVQDMLGATTASDPADITSLSNRELTIFELIGSKRTTQEIAGQLGISTKTVMAHRANIRRKLTGISARQLERQAQAWMAQSTMMSSDQSIASSPQCELTGTRRKTHTAMHEGEPL